MWFPSTELRRVFFMKAVEQETLTHSQKVTRQYKKVLVTCRDHAGFSREFYVRDVGEARFQFEKNRHLATEEEKEYALYQGDLWLRQHRHHAPYILPYLPDGSKYQRNMTIPQSLTSENRLVDLEAEIRREFEGTQSNPLVDTWKLQE
eukprot:TRINITY_DN375_c0_g2_i1.p1 TRINITY_DN375_c0_g2~~TRINITY_DN375_c0_g2_i1.p1  ORF type:complete len:148 (-),score=24.31 TRINITY_DN375_c0_g2_i1:39-482(-)